MKKQIIKLPKKGLLFLIVAGIILVLIILVFSVYMSLLVKQTRQSANLIHERSRNTYSFNYPFKSDTTTEAFTFEIPRESDVQLLTWLKLVSGKISVSIIGSNGETVFESLLEKRDQAQPIHLKAGEYQVMVQISNAFAVGGAVGVDESSIFSSMAKILSDNDQDGLPDEMEASAGINPNAADTDSDLLSDYDETVKYKSNPLKADSDADGISDNDWNERRENVYTVRVLLKLREPFLPETMNDPYQDVKILTGPDEGGYATLEAIIYPDSQELVTASRYPITGLSDELNSFTQPGIATNYSAEMQAKVREIVAGSTTDIQAVQKILDWVNNNTGMALDYSIPEVYFTYLDGNQVRMRNYHDAVPEADLLRTQYFAESMFNEKVHGTCTSIATLKCAMIKSAGIPCRLIQTFFPLYYHGSQTQPFDNQLSGTRDFGDCSYIQPAGDDVINANHAFMEVYLGGRWIRVDQTFGIFQEQSACLGLKLLSVADWSEVDFSQTWPTDWIDDRPYYTLLIEDQEAKP